MNSCDFIQEASPFCEFEADQFGSPEEKPSRKARFDLGRRHIPSAGWEELLFGEKKATKSDWILYHCSSDWLATLPESSPTQKTRPLFGDQQPHANVLEHLVQAQIQRIFKVYERRFRTQITIAVREQLLPEIRKEVIRELASGELFGAATDSAPSMAEWCHKHSKIFEAHPSTNIAVDLETESVLLDDPNDLSFVKKLAVLEKERGKRFTTFRTDNLPNH